MTPAVNYQEHWRRYKRLRNFFLLIWLAYIPAVAVFTLVFSHRFRNFTPSFVFAILWMLMFLIVGSRVSRWPCPRCGERFSQMGWVNRGFFVRKCLHCGLPKYSDGDVQQ